MTAEEKSKIDLIYDIVVDVAEKVDDIRTHNAEQDVAIQKVTSKTESIQGELKEHKENNDKSITKISDNLQKHEKSPHKVKSNNTALNFVWGISILALTGLAIFAMYTLPLLGQVKQALGL
jgi:phage-related tail protein